MKVYIYEQRWTEGKISQHRSPDDIQQFARDFYKMNPNSTLTQIGDPQSRQVNKGTADKLGKFGSWK